MSILVVSYSRTGNNALLARHLAKRLEADHEELVEGRSRRGNWGVIRSVFQAALGIPSKIAPLDRNPKEYDTVVCCSPVWSGRITPALRRFLKTYRPVLERVAYASISLNDHNEPALKDVRSSSGKEPVAILELPLKDGVSEQERKELRHERLRPSRFEEPSCGRKIGVFLEKVCGESSR